MANRFGLITERKEMLKNSEVKSSLQNACAKIAPLWSLENFVAVNPFWELKHLPFEKAAGLLEKTGGAKLTMPFSFYIEKINEGEISTEDLQGALLSDEMTANLNPKDFLKQIELQEKSDYKKQKVNLVVDAASAVSVKNWSEFFIERITSWAAAYFDRGQTSWRTSSSEQNIFSSWKIEASADATPAIMGLKNFRDFVKNLPEDPFDAATESLRHLKIPSDGLDIYLHALLRRVGGWSAYIAGLDWDNRLYGEHRTKLPLFLAVLISWESCLLKSYGNSRLENYWENELKRLPKLQNNNEIGIELRYKLILQRAYDNAYQRRLIIKINSSEEKISAEKPLVQAVFCIDVRSEILRRNLEIVSSRVQTFGFAGFFAFPVKYIQIGRESAQNQCPVLIPAKATVIENIDEPNTFDKAIRKRKINYHVEKIWNSFKKGAISCFSFMGPVGLSYLPKLYLDAFGLTRPVSHPDIDGLGKNLYAKRNISFKVSNIGEEVTGISLDDQIEMAHSALKGMSLTENFAKLILITGHGSTSVNNPHATGLDCGACGGHSGEVNAKVAVQVLNNPDVRKGLAKHNIAIPDDTYFISGLHDTTTDRVVLFDEKNVPESHLKDLNNLKEWLDLAGQASRLERSARLIKENGTNIEKDIFKRSMDWSQVRPEWGLAGCNAFIVAPRHRTMNIDLSGKSFLHTYDWKTDEGLKVLELIMTAPMIVTSWINLQYYASVVDNKNFGSGNKTLHNVTSGIGVLEGFTGDLRTGLPWQSIHDGNSFQHLPHMLNVIIEAPMEAINEIVKKHEDVKNLFDNGWINLLRMDDQGLVSHKYLGRLEWEDLSIEDEEALVA